MNDSSALMAHEDRLELEIVPGVTFPNWSAVTDDKVAEALTAILLAFNVEERWSGLGGDENLVRRAILAEYAKTGHAPSHDRLAEVTGREADDLRRILKRLRGRDIVVLDDDDETITGAYPFTDRTTEHSVHLGDVVVNAMCAIDALGTGAMCGKGSVIHSSCRACGRPIVVETTSRGKEIAAASLDTTVVWSGIQYTNGCSADTMCTVMAFFCTDDCLKSWREANASDVNGYRLSLEEGLQVGKAIFMPLLVVASANL